MNGYKSLIAYALRIGRNQEIRKPPKWRHSELYNGETTQREIDYDFIKMIEEQDNIDGNAISERLIKYFKCAKCEENSLKKAES